jgi:hypothetical protein
MFVFWFQLCLTIPFDTIIDDIIADIDSIHRRRLHLFHSQKRPSAPSP